jgi:hypothetical protein
MIVSFQSCLASNAALRTLSLARVAAATPALASARLQYASSVIHSSCSTSLVSLRAKACAFTPSIHDALSSKALSDAEYAGAWGWTFWHTVGLRVYFLPRFFYLTLHIQVLLLYFCLNQRMLG